jgi:hypothetical protein
MKLSIISTLLPGFAIRRHFALRNVRIEQVRTSRAQLRRIGSPMASARRVRKIALQGAATWHCIKGDFAHAAGLSLP